jgi:hypothetical protein
MITLVTFHMLNRHRGMLAASKDRAGYRTFPISPKELVDSLDLQSLSSIKFEINLTKLSSIIGYHNNTENHIKLIVWILFSIKLYISTNSVRKFSGPW